MKLLHGDCLNILKTLPDNSVDSIVTDPPAGIAFMNKDWDKNKGSRDEWITWMQGVAEECKRVLKPGGHALVWTIPRTSHWTAMAWENAGWEVRDKIAHVFGSGFPKSHNISIAIDKRLNAEREVIGVRPQRANNTNRSSAPMNASRGVVELLTAPATPEAQQWDGWGTALKPAREDWLLLRKPFKGTVAANVLEHGTGGLNIDATRIGTFNDGAARSNTPGSGRMKSGGGLQGTKTFSRSNASSPLDENQGRFPANFIHDGSDEVLELFPETGSSARLNSKGKKYDSILNANVYGKYNPTGHNSTHDDSGSAARYFYCAKASKRDRDEGLEDFELKKAESMCANTGEVMALGGASLKGGHKARQNIRNVHPTVKPTSLMQYLCRLITPPNGIILDPFMGSGSTGKGAILEGFDFIGIEQEKEYLDIAKARIEYVVNKQEQESVQQEKSTHYIVAYPTQCEECGADAKWVHQEYNNGDIVTDTEEELKCNICKERTWAIFEPYVALEDIPLFSS